jgi:hypothetical protein
MMTVILCRLEYPIEVVDSISAEGYDGILYISNGLTDQMTHPKPISSVLETASQVSRSKLAKSFY